MHAHLPHSEKHAGIIKQTGKNNSPFPLLLWLFLCFLFSISDFSFFVFCLLWLNVLKREEKLLELLRSQIGRGKKCRYEHKRQTQAPQVLPSFCDFQNISAKITFAYLIWFPFLGLLVIFGLYFLRLKFRAEKQCYKFGHHYTNTLTQLNTHGSVIW